MAASRTVSWARSSFTREQGFAPYVARGTMLQGWALAALGQVEEGIVQMRQGLASAQGEVAEAVRVSFPTLLAATYRRGGQVDNGLGALAEALAVVEATELRFHEAELYRLKGELLWHTACGMPYVEEAEVCFQKALNVARRQCAKSWELRAATSPGRLWQRQGKSDAARQLLTPIYGWFSEGFDTPDLREAKDYSRRWEQLHRWGATLHLVPLQTA